MMDLNLYLCVCLHVCVFVSSTKLRETVTQHIGIYVYIVCKR